MVFSGPSVVFTVERSAKDWLTEGGGRGCSALVSGGGRKKSALNKSRDAQLLTNPPK